MQATTMGLQMPKKGDLHSIGSSTPVTLGLVVALGMSLASGVWWARGIESDQIRIGERLAAIESQRINDTATATSLQSRLARIEALLETANDRLQRLERDRRGALGISPTPTAN